MIKAITFDFWDTLVFDESDEPKRAAQGLLPKPQARLQLLAKEIGRHHPHTPPDRVAAAFDRANARVQEQWRDENHTAPVSERLQLAYDELQLAHTPGFDALVHAIEMMEVDIPPDFVPGVRATLADLAREFKLGIISDTIHTPGRGLRALLEREGLLEYFSHRVFSDEVGASKPARRVFELASTGLAVPLENMAHIGDRESNDVAGAQSAGMQAILFTGAVDRDSAKTSADVVCVSMEKLPDVVRHLAKT